MVKRKGIKILIIILLSFAVLYTIMFLNVKSLVDYVVGVSEGEIPYSEIEGTPLEFYAVIDGLEAYDDVKTVDMEIKTCFTLHNFFEGYIFLKYDLTGYDKNGEMVCYWEAAPKWHIKRIDGNWQILDIDEPVKDVGIPWINDENLWLNF